MPQWYRICSCCVSEGVPRRSFGVALIVGTILNLINQGDALLGGGDVDLVKLLLTYAVPYCVATYGAISFRLATEGANGFRPPPAAAAAAARARSMDSSQPD